MPDVFLSRWEIGQIINAIEVSTTFYRACKKSARYASVVDAFDAMLLSQQNLQEKLKNILSQQQKE